MKGKKRGKGTRIALICLAAVIAVYAVFCLAFGPVIYPAFYDIASKEERIPDFWKKFVPQGVTQYGGVTAVCGYTTDSSASRIYFTAGGKTKKILLEREDGTVYTGHAGGMTANGDFTYISNASKIFVLKTADLFEAANGDTVAFIGHFEVPCRASFCSFSGGKLFVGEYHADGYETEESHRVETADGTYRAVVFAYPIDAASEFGVKTEPSLAYAVRDCVQGFAEYGGTAVLSCSSGFADSTLRFYDCANAFDGTIAVEGRNVPLAVLDSARETVVLKAPHMSEDLEFLPGGKELLVAFEAGALKFGGGLLPFSVRHVMRLDVREVMP